MDVASIVAVMVDTFRIQQRAG